MAITTPTSLQVPAAYELILPPVGQQPLKKLLEDLNYLWRFHQPPLVSACYTSAFTLSRNSTYVVPIIPSADGVEYTFDHYVVTSAATNLTITVDYTTAYAGGGTVWTNIYSQVVVTAVGLNRRTDTGKTIPATAVALRIDYVTAVGSHSDHWACVRPAPTAAPTAGIKASGFIPFDDGLLTDTDKSPIHTEHIDRCKVSAVALLRDRRQCLFSWLQEETRANCPVSVTATDWLVFPKVRCYVPGQTSQSIAVTFRALATVDAGGTADLVRVKQVVAAGSTQAPKSVLFAASGAIVSQSLTLYPETDENGRYVDIELSVKANATRTTIVHAVVGFWRPGD